jgi:hypothetical protein
MKSYRSSLSSTGASARRELNMEQIDFIELIGLISALIVGMSLAVARHSAKRRRLVREAELNRLRNL